MSRIIDLNQRKTRLIADATALVNEGKAATDEYRNIVAEIDSTQAHIDSLQRLERLQSSSQPAPVAAAPAVAPVAAPAAVNRNETKKQKRQRLNVAFRSLLQHGYNPEGFPEQRDITTGSSGSPLIPQTTFPVLGQVAKYWAPLLDYLTVKENTTARPTRFVSEDDSSNFLVAGSQGTAPTETDQTFSKVLLDHDLISGLITVSLQLLNDSEEFDLTDVITRAAGKRLGRSLESILTNGVDPASNAMANNQGLINAASVGVTTTTLANGVSESDISGLIKSLDPTYWNKAVFTFSAGTYAYLMEQKTSTGARFWPELGSMKLWDFDVVINNSLPQSFIANGIPIIFGDLSTYAVSHTGLSVQTLFERFADTFKRGFVLSSRVASQQLSPGGIVSLKLASS